MKIIKTVFMIIFTILSWLITGIFSLLSPLTFAELWELNTAKYVCVEDEDTGEVLSIFPEGGEKTLKETLVRKYNNIWKK